MKHLKTLTRLSVRLIAICSILLFCRFESKSQNQSGISYQAVVRDIDNKLVSNQEIGIQFSILNESEQGETIYTESHNSQTNINGLISLEIGQNGELFNINWSEGPFFIKTEIDLQGGTNYTITDIKQIQTIPYSIYAHKAGNTFSGDYNDLTNTPNIPSKTSQLDNDLGFITNFIEIDGDPQNEIQIISISNDTIFLSDGGFVKIPEGFSGKYEDLENKPNIPSKTSELDNDQGFITDFIETDGDPQNEIQIISIENDTVFLTNGGYAKLPVAFSGNYNDLDNKPFLQGDVSGETDSTLVRSIQGRIVANTIPAQNQILKWDTTYKAWIPKDDALGAAGTVDGVVNSITINGTDQKIVTLNRSNGLANISGTFDDLVDDADSDPTNEFQILSINEDTIYLSNGGSVVLPEGFDGQYNSLSGVPTKISDFSNDEGYITDGNTNWNNTYGFLTNPDDADADPTNEFQIISINEDTIHLSNGGSVTLPAGFSGSFNDLSDVPINIDTDASDDFNGDYNSLVNKPNLGIYLTSEMDADPANEIQVLSLKNDTIYLSNGGYVKLPKKFSGKFTDLTHVPINLDLDQTDDFDGNYYSLSNRPTIPENASELTNDAGYVLSSELLDDDPVNELQTIRISNDTVYLSRGGYIKIPEGFSGDFNDLTNIPSLLGDVNGDMINNKVSKIQGMLISENIPADGQVLKWDANNSQWIPQDDMLGADGTTDGVVTSVGVVEIGTSKTLTLTRSVGSDLTAIFSDEIEDADADPTNEIEVADQSGNSGKFLTTDGSNTYWDFVTAPGDNLGNHQLSQNLNLNDLKLTNNSTTGISINNLGQTEIDADNFNVLTLKRTGGETGGAAIQFINRRNRVGAIGLGDNGAVFIKTPKITNGSALFVDSLGKVGIGSIQPKSKLHLVGGSLTISGTDSAKFFLANRADTGFKTVFISEKVNPYGGANLHIALNNSMNYSHASIKDAKLSILNNGFVGIGTKTPNEMLEVNGKILATNLQLTENAVSNYILTSDGSGNAIWTDPLNIMTSDSDPENEIELPDQAGNSGKFLTTDGINPIWESISTTGGSDGMGNHSATQNIKMNNYWLSNDGSNHGVFVDTLGNVGIGTNSPKNKLSIDGSLQLNNWRVSTPYTDRLVFESLENSASILTIKVNESTKKSEIDFGDNEDYNPGRISYQHTAGNTDDYMSFTVNDNEKIRILENGDIGLGTSNPKGKLHIKGNEFILASSGTASLYLSNTQNNQHKTAIISEKSGNWGRAKMHFALNNNEDLNNASVEDAKLTILPNGNVGIGEKSPENRLNVTANTTKHVMLIENQDNNSGDGLAIKLNRTHPAWNGLAYITMNDPIKPAIEANREILEDMIKGEIENIGFDVIVDLANDIFGESLLSDAAKDLYNSAANIINEELNLPMSYYFNIKVKRGKVFNDFKVPVGVYAWGLNYKKYDFPTQDLSIFKKDLTLIPEFPKVPLDDPNFEMPKFEDFTFQNSLSSENEFVTFYDGDDRWCGAIAGESLEDWFTGFLEVNNLIQFVTGVATIDPSDDALSAIAFASDHIASYNSLGVSYQSGHGDYAEWLERINPEENISAGDIVGVIGGKITKDLTNAEQIMAVSDKPIIIGNTPDKEKLHLGNNVAFMGQIPVKIMGSVKTGDYIVANPDIKGYGIAINPEYMTPENFKRAIGRSWDENPADGAKLVNTVIGVHNGDWIKIVIKQQNEIEEANKRLDKIEQQLQKLIN